MASFDVVSLFTNIPLNESIDLCTDLVFENRQSFEYEECKFDRNNFSKLLSFAVKDNHFMFNGKLYDQIDGVAMGSPLGPTFANVFMCFLEDKYLSECPLQFKPALYRRYVDDTFCLFKEKSDIYRFLDHINSYHPSIKFTVEIEDNCSLPFLDVLVNKEGIDFSTSLFRKQTFTGLYTNFASLSPTRYKTNLVRILVFCAFHICSSFVNFHKEIVRIKEILRANCFPVTLIDNVIRNFLNRQYIPCNKPKDKNEDKPRIICCLPFLGKRSFRIRNDITRLIKTHYLNTQVQFIFKSAKRISSMFQYKDRIPTLVCSNVIYKFSCSGCNASYYGKTNRNLLIRCNEHLGINRNGRELSSPSPSSIRNHIKQTGHTASIDDFSVISKTSNSYDLLIHESLLIQRDRPSLNSQQSSISMVLF